MKHLWLIVIASLGVASPAAAQIAQTTTCDAAGIASR